MQTEVLTKEQIFAELKEFIENDLDFKGVTEEITFEGLSAWIALMWWSW